MPGYACGGCDGAEPAVILITPLNGAETLAVGENCMPVTWCGILAGVIGVDAELLWDACVELKRAIADQAEAFEGQVAEDVGRVVVTAQLGADGRDSGETVIGDAKPPPPKSAGRPPTARKPRARR